MGKNKGILKYWQTIAALVGFVFAIGVFVNKSDYLAQKVEEIKNTAAQRDSDLNNRINNQYDALLKINDRVIAVEKESAYQKGFHDGKGDHEKSLYEK